MDYGSSFSQGLALLWSVRQWTELEEEYHHFARMGKCENSLDSLRMTRNAEISAKNQQFTLTIYNRNTNEGHTG